MKNDQVLDTELRSFEVDPIRGYLPEVDPLRQLPARFLTWDELGGNLPKFLTGSGIRETIEKMPILSIDDLKSSAELHRAMMILSYLGHAYVWGESPPPKSFPKSLALPWYAISQKLGRPPVLSYASYALHNWRRLDPTKPIELGNIVLLQNFLGGIDEEWFILIHVDIEAKAAALLRAIWYAQAAIPRGDRGVVAEALEVMTTALQKMNTTMDRMPERCDPYIYFHRVRPYIHGWKNNPAIPDGLIYEGVAEYGGRPQQFRGETGSQSSIVPALDAALQISHQDDPLRAHLLEMQFYMPARHQAFIAAISQRPSIREYVAKESAQMPQLKTLFNDCISQIERFRTTHLEYAATYIFKQAQKEASNPSAVGTGGTPFMPYLKKHRDETAAQKL